jgi:hypothetical protein
MMRLLSDGRAGVLNRLVPQVRRGCESGSGDDTLRLVRTPTSAMQWNTVVQRWEEIRSRFRIRMGENSVFGVSSSPWYSSGHGRENTIRSAMGDKAIIAMQPTPDAPQQSHSIN